MKKKNNKVNNKNVKQETIKYVNEDTDQIKKFILILIGVALVALLLYFVTAKFLVKDNFQEEDTPRSEATIEYDTVKVGNIFNRPYDEYYVFAYDSSSTKAGYYATISSRSSKEKIYFLDLNLDINKKYVGEEGNKSASSAEEIVLKDPTLIKIKGGKIVEYYENIDDIVKTLK